MTYIHERKDWPALVWDQPHLEPRLIAVRHRQGRFIGRMEAIGIPLRAEASLQSLTENVVKSSEIEGETLSREQVRSSLARRLGIEAGALTPADRHVEGVVEMMLDATQKYGTPHSPSDRRYGLGSVREKHPTFLQHVSPNQCGTQGVLRYFGGHPEREPRYHRLARLVFGMFGPGIRWGRVDVVRHFGKSPFLADPFRRTL